MDIEKKICCNEGVPLNTEPTAANIFLNTTKSTKGTSTGTIIHLKTNDASANQDVGLHINTSYTAASSRRLKFLFIVNFIVCAICIFISCAVAFCYWKDMVMMRTQLDLIREQLLFDSGYRDSASQTTQKKVVRPYIDNKHNDDGIKAEARTFYVDNLGQEPFVFVDSSNKKQENKISRPNETDSSLFGTKGATIIQFVGSAGEIKIGEESVIGPWVLDNTVSSKDASKKVDLSPDFKTFKVVESGVYFLYSQVVYISHTPSYYGIFARKLPERPRLLVICSSADVFTKRSVSRSQITCSTQTMVRLNAGETIIISQREQNMTVWLKPGHTFFGLVKLGD